MDFKKQKDVEKQLNFLIKSSLGEKSHHKNFANVAR